MVEKFSWWCKQDSWIASIFLALWLVFGLSSPQISAASLCNRRLCRIKNSLAIHFYSFLTRSGSVNLSPDVRLSQNSQQTPYHPGSSQLSGTSSILAWQRLTDRRFPLQIVNVDVVLSAEVVCSEELVSLPLIKYQWWSMLGKSVMTFHGVEVEFILSSTKYYDRLRFISTAHLYESKLMRY